MLPREDFDKCIRGLIDSMKRGPSAIGNFHGWIEASFGAGLAEVFMLPYNVKVWRMNLRRCLTIGLENGWRPSI
jgi:protoporphyrinogen oxidase